MEKTKQGDQTAIHEDQTISAKGLSLHADEAEAALDTSTYAQKLHPLWATFRNILLVVLLLFVCAVVQMLLLMRVCDRGMETAATLEHQGLPTLNSLATMQEHLAIYRLNAYEYLFAHQEERARRARAVTDTAAETRAELENIRTLLPEGEGRRLAADLERAFADLDAEFRKVQSLVDSDFAAAMERMDQNIPPLTDRVTVAANAFSKYGYHMSGGQANATFDSFGWIKRNTIMFGAANIVVVLGAVIFVLLAARRNRALLSKTMARVEQRTRELAQSLSLLNATLESTADGILVLNQQGRMMSYNAKFAQMWRLPREIVEFGNYDEMLTAVVGQLKDQEAFVRRLREFSSNPDMEGLDLLEFKDGRVFERYTQPQRLDGATIGRVWCFRDVTERVRAEEALQQERNLLRTLIDHIPDFIYVRDLSNRFVVANESFARLMGADRPSALIGRRDADYYPPEAAAIYGAVDQEVFAGHSRYNGERMIHFPNGQKLATLTTKVPFKNDKGEVIGLIGIGRDVTERKRVEAELDYERGLLRMMLENSPDQIYFKDAESRFIKVSTALAVKLGLGAPDEMVGRTDYDFFTEEHARPAFEDEQAILTTGRPLIGRVEKEITKDGRVSWALTNKMPLRNKDGQVIGTFGITKDITAIKEAEFKLEQIHRQLLDTSRLAGMAEVATNVLHNVGNVLNSVNISTGLLAECVKQSKVESLARVVALLREHDHDLGEFVTRDANGKHVLPCLAGLAEHFVASQETMAGELDSLRRNIDHIKEIVATQQSYARVGGVKETVDLIHLVEDSLRINEQALNRHHVEVVREFETVPPLNVEKHKILQILVNLLRNAKHACQDSPGTDARLTVRVANHAGRVRISVQDNGVGIAPENLTRIFNHGFTTRKDGHGFGLHSGALAAREMGGALTVHSDGPGRGATFTLDLPCPTLKDSHE